MKEERDPLHQDLSESPICRNNALDSPGRVPCLVSSHLDMYLNNCKMSRPDQHVYLWEALQPKAVCSVNRPREGGKPGICPSLLDRDNMTLLIVNLLSEKILLGRTSHLVHGGNDSQRELHVIWLSVNALLTYMQSLNVYYFTSMCEIITSVLLIVLLQTVIFFFLSIKIHQVFKGYFNTAFLQGSGKSVYNRDKEKLSSAYLIPWSRAKTPDC